MHFPLQLPPPANWQDFETLCLALWIDIWGDPEAKKHGRQGQPQHGVDIYGRLAGGGEWAGVQCKLRDQFSESRVSLTELKGEIEKAKQFQPRLEYRGGLKN